MKYNSKKKKITEFITIPSFDNCFYIIEVGCKFVSYKCDDEIYL